jgi:hypothetical protein
MFLNNVIAFVSLLSGCFMYYDCGFLEYELAEFSRQAPQFQLNLLLQSAA